MFFLLDILNNIIQYQAEGNSAILYALLRQKSIFKELETL